MSDLEFAYLVYISPAEVRYGRIKIHAAESGLKRSSALVNFRLIRVLGGVLAVTMGCAFYGAIRLSYADYLAGGDSSRLIQSALKLAPDNAAYWLRWTDLVEAEGRPGDAGIQHAAELDPYDASVWIRAGLKAEIQGRYTEAEQDLLQAARRSRQFEPRWALANFYFRRGDAEHFWDWANSALPWAYQDRTPLFELCWRMQPDAALILRRAIPDDPKVLRNYLEFLLATRRFDAAAAVAERLESRATAEDRDLLLGYSSLMLEQKRWAEALAAWNALCLRNLVPYPQLVPGKGPVLTNGAFSAEPLNRGFDWHIWQLPGVSVVRGSSPGRLEFSFNGQQPENCLLLDQFIPVIGGRRYDFRFAYRTDSIAPGSGLHWTLTEAATGAAIPLEQPPLSSDDWTIADSGFQVPVGAQGARLALVYERQPGTVRLEGAFWLRDLAMELLP